LPYRPRRDDDRDWPPDPPRDVRADALVVGRELRVPLRPELLPLRLVPALAVLLLLVPLCPLRPLPLRSFRLLPLAERSWRLFPLRPLAVPFRLRPEPVLALRSIRLLVPLRLRPEPLPALRSFRLLLRSFRLPLFRSLRLPLLPRPFRVPEERSVAAVRVRVGVGLSSLLAAACSWSIRCPASLVQLCEGTPRALSWRAKLLAAASFGKGPTSSRLGAV
jgi:hypothetical protein